MFLNRTYQSHVGLNFWISLVYLPLYMKIKDLPWLPYPHYCWKYFSWYLTQWFVAEVCLLYWKGRKYTHIRFFNLQLFNFLTHFTMSTSFSFLSNDHNCSQSTNFLTWDLKVSFLNLFHCVCYVHHLEEKTINMHQLYKMFGRQKCEVMLWKGLRFVDKNLKVRLWTVISWRVVDRNFM